MPARGLGVPQKLKRRVHKKSAITSPPALSSCTVPAIRSPSYSPSKLRRDGGASAFAAHSITKPARSSSESSALLGVHSSYCPPQCSAYGTLQLPLSNTAMAGSCLGGGGFSDVSSKRIRFGRTVDCLPRRLAEIFQTPLSDVRISMPAVGRALRAAAMQAAERRSSLFRRGRGDEFRNRNKSWSGARLRARGQTRR